MIIPRVFRIFTIIIGLTLSSIGCHPQKSLNGTPSIHPTSAIIFIPGYYGTKLARDVDDAVVWVSASELLFGQQPLTLPVPDLALTNTIKLHPTDVLDTVGVIPFLYSVDVYGSLLDELRSIQQETTQVIPFPYDWRNDLMESVQSLHEIIVRLRVGGNPKNHCRGP